MSSVSAADLVRLQCGEDIPPGGSDADTMFTDEQIQTFLLTNNNSVNGATANAWRIKAARFAAQVDIVEGNSQRKMSQAYQQAKSQATYWANQPDNNAYIGKSRQVINRRTMPW